jgi:hypothetical protein
MVQNPKNLSFVVIGSVLGKKWFPIIFVGLKKTVFKLFSSFLLFAWWSPLVFLVRIFVFTKENRGGAT